MTGNKICATIGGRMNKIRRQRLQAAADLLAQARDVVEQVRDDEQDAIDNLPENLMYSDRAEAMEEAVEALDSAIHVGVGIVFVAIMVRIARCRTKDPMPDGYADCVEAVVRNPREIRFRNPRIPMLTQPPRRLLASELDAPGGFIVRRHSLEQAWLHPLFKHKPSSKVHTSDTDTRLVVGNR